jgi:hypothetical protein
MWPKVAAFLYAEMHYLAERVPILPESTIRGLERPAHERLVV